MIDSLSHDPVLQRLANTRGAFRSPALQTVCDRAVLRRRSQLLDMAVNHGHGEWPAVPPRELIGVGDVPLGGSCSGPALLPLDCLNSVSVLCGPPNCGKSTLLYAIAEAAMARRVTCLLTDTKSRAGVDLPVSIPMLTPREAALSLASPELDQEEWFTRVLWVIEHTAFIVSGSQHLRAVFRRLLSSCPAGRELCLADLADALCKSPAASERFKPQARETAAAVMQRLVEADKGLFTTSCMLPWARRLRASHGVWLQGMHADAARVFVLLTLLAFIAHGTSAGVQNRRLRMLGLIDDARAIVKSLRREGASGTDPLQHIADTANSAGVGLLLAVQSLSAEVPESLVHTAGVLILVGPQSGEDVQLIRRDWELTEAQASFLLHQPPFQAVARIRMHPWSMPFPVRLVLQQRDPLELCRQQELARTDLLAGHEFSPWSCLESEPSADGPATRDRPPNVAHADRGTRPSLDQGAFQLLVHSLRHRHLIQSELGQRVGVQGRELTACREKLESLGFVRLWRLGRFAVWETTESGAAHVGVQWQTLDGRGNYDHRFVQERVRVFLLRSCSWAGVEVPHGDGALDVMGKRPDGTRVAYEVVLCMETATRAIQKLASFDGQAVLILPDAKSVARVWGEIHGSLFSNSPALSILTLQELIEQTRSER